MNEPIILASASPRRSQLLSWAEIPFTVVVSEAEETYPEGLKFEEIAMHIATSKAKAVSSFLNTAQTILAADTIVICDDMVLGKPADRNDAVRMLKILGGNIHKVITGVTIINPGKQKSFADVTSVEFHELSDDQIEFYVDKYKPYDKAGAYAIQEWIGVVGIKSITGDFYNVMGLPVSRVVQELREF